MTADSTTVEIVNTNQVEEQRLVVQGGAYGEHKIVSAATDGGGAHEYDSPAARAFSAARSCSSPKTCRAQLSQGRAATGKTRRPGSSGIASRREPRPDPLRILFELELTKKHKKH